MKKRIFALALVLVMALGLMLPVTAYEDHNYLYIAISDMDNQRFIDQGETTLPTLSDQFGCSLRVDIVDGTEDETLEDYAEIFYNQYGYGDDHDGNGALLMIQVEDLGGSVDIVGYVIYGEGRGADAIKSQGAAMMTQTLDVTLTGSGLSYAEAGETCAGGVDTFAGIMASILMAMPAAGNTDPAEPAAPVTPETTTEPAAPAEPAEPATPKPAETTKPEASAAPSAAPAESPAAEQRFILDEAGLLTHAQKLKLESQAQKAAEMYDCGVYVLTVDTMNGMERREYAKEYYANHKLGVGDFQNGILFLVCMDTREYVTITYGRNPNKITEYGPGILAFTDEGIAAMEDAVTPKLSDGDYSGAFDTYVSTCTEYLDYYKENGEGKVPISLTSILIRLAIVILVPLGIAGGVCWIFVRQMKTARAATTAGDYIPADSFQLSRERDQYTHTTTERRKIEKESSSGGSGSSSVDSDGYGGSSGGHF